MKIGENKKYLNVERSPLPFCPGCGHTRILNHLDEALAQLNLDPNRTVIVTDIGCSGLSDQYFNTQAFHGLHGRAVTYASGIKLADPKLTVIVLMGDGGCGIGGHHLINAARRNIGITTLVFNNFNYGMTGGQHSVTTPLNAITATTPLGNFEKPMDVCATVAVNGAGFVARTTAFDVGLTDLIVQAVSHDGFSLIDIWELCTAYFVPNNKFSKKLLEETMAVQEFQTGVIHLETRPEFCSLIRASKKDAEQTKKSREVFTSHYSHQLDGKINLIIAGTAGKKIGTSAGIFCKAALLSGLNATQRNDYMVTVRTGYSISEVILSSREIFYSGVPRADIMIVLFAEGLKKVTANIRALTGSDYLLINSDLLPIESKANILALDFKLVDYNSEYWTIMALAELIRFTKIFPLEALIEAVELHPKTSERYLYAIKKSKGVISLVDSD